MRSVVQDTVGVQAGEVPATNGPEQEGVELIRIGDHFGLDLHAALGAHGLRQVSTVCTITAACFVEIVPAAWAAATAG